MKVRERVRDREKEREGGGIKCVVMKEITI